MLFRFVFSVRVILYLRVVTCMVPVRQEHPKCSSGLLLSYAVVVVVGIVVVVVVGVSTVVLAQSGSITTDCATSTVQDSTVVLYY